MKMNELFKYPRTPHLPISEGATSDDKYASKESVSFLKSGIPIVVTEKMDGGNLTMYRDNFHARSLTSGTHAWDTAAKALWARIHNEIPEGWRISGESMYARRSVSYENLPDVYMVFGIWNEDNCLISWEDTVEWCSLLGLSHVPVIYSGTDFDKGVQKWFENYDSETSEGFVVRNAESFHYDDFSQNIAKWVRADHIRTNRADWRYRRYFKTNTFANL